LSAHQNWVKKRVLFANFYDHISSWDPAPWTMLPMNQIAAAQPIKNEELDTTFFAVYQFQVPASA